MGIVWQLVQAAGPYVKIVEYAVVIAILIASIYTGRKIRETAREIKQIMHASSEDLRQDVQDVSATLESDFRRITDKLREEVAALTAGVVEGRVESTDAGRESSDEGSPVEGLSEQRLGKRAVHRQWWQPVVDVKFDDAEQEQPKLYWSNNVRTPLPWPGTWLTGWRNVSEDGVCGVALSGTKSDVEAFWRTIRPEARQIEAALPKGSTVDRGRFGIRTTKPNKEFRTDDEKRAWIKANLNQFVNVLRPRMKAALNKQLVV
jgi:hypothetical protein